MAVAVAVCGPAAAGGVQPFTVTGDAVASPLGGLAGDAARGRAVVVDRRRGNCLICHAVPTVAAPFQGRIGPSLAGVGGRLTAVQMRLRLIDQSRIKPDTIMPPYYRTEDLHDVAPEYRGKPALGAQEIEDVLAFLMTLKAAQ